MRIIFKINIGIGIGIGIDLGLIPEPKRYFGRKSQKQFHRYAYSTWSQDRPTKYKSKKNLVTTHSAYPTPKFVSAESNIPYTKWETNTKDPKKRGT